MKNLTKFEYLIFIAEYLLKSPQYPTYLEVSNHRSQFENVCSTILAFFFDSRREHQLDDLLVKSLLSVYSVSKIDCGKVLSVEREVGDASSSKRLDILIETEKCVIGIENKIDTEQKPDLSIYSQMIEDRSQGCKTPIKIVLSAKDEKASDGFEFISYGKFFKEIRVNVGEYLTPSNGGDVACLYDFFEIVENLKSTPERHEFFEQKDAVANAEINSDLDQKRYACCHSNLEFLEIRSTCASILAASKK
jgi:hypothetical protein